MVARAGYAAEVVSKDYGEDLLVQTSHAGQMDASRLWLQVKGTADIKRHLLKSGDMRLSVSFEHALRWSRSADLVAVVLWDAVASQGWYTLPLYEVDPLEGFLSAQKRTTLRFDQQDVFTVDVVRMLAWESRIEHFRQLMLSARSIDMQRKEKGETSKLVSLLALDFLMLLGLVVKTEEPVEYGVPMSIRSELGRRFTESSERGEDPEAALYEATISTLFASVPRRRGHKSLPRILVEEPVETLISILGIPGVIRAAREGRI